MTIASDLFAARAALVTSLDYCDRGAFPGTRAWRAEAAAMAALDAFDVAHPEVRKALHEMDAKKNADLVQSAWNA